MSAADPEIAYRELAGGDPGRITLAADPITKATTALGDAGTSLDASANTARGGWQGDAATAFVSRIDNSSAASLLAKTRIGWGGQLLGSLAEQYTKVRTSADQAIAVWRNRTPGTDEQQLATQVNARLAGLRSSWESTLRSYASRLNGISPGFAAQAGDSPGWAATAPLPGLTMPAAGTDPKDVARWWAGLSETERDQLLATKFDQLGRLRGLPAEVLDQANRRRIEVDKARFGAARSDLDARIKARAAELGLDPSDTEKLRESNDPQLASLLDQRADADRRLSNANAAAQRLEDAAKQAKDKGIPGTYVLSYDPDGPGRKQGVLAVAYGNPDTAANVAVVVPGTGTTLANGFPGGSAADLWSQMHGAAPGTNNATIAWLGYDAPEWDTSVMGSHNAEEGGALLKSDVDGYRAAAATAGNQQHLTVIGHSYGSTTVGYAGLDGLAADDIAFVGSPGVGASNADQFPAGHGHVWAGATEHDPVVQATSGDWFTKDGSSTGPYDKSFGANVFGTKDDTNLLGAHSNYYDPGSESLRNLGNIATGNYSDVSKQNWLDSPLPPELPGSNLPVAGPVIDDLGNVGKETIDVGRETASGLWNTGGDLVHGDFDGAWNDLANTGGQVLNDAGDVVVGGLGDLGEEGRDLVDAGVSGAKGVYDNTLGRLF